MRVVRPTAGAASDSLRWIGTAPRCSCLDGPWQCRGPESPAAIAMFRSQTLHAAAEWIGKARIRMQALFSLSLVYRCPQRCGLAMAVTLSMTRPERLSSCIEHSHQVGEPPGSSSYVVTRTITLLSEGCAYSLCLLQVLNPPDQCIRLGFAAAP